MSDSCAPSGEGEQEVWGCVGFSGCAVSLQCITHLGEHKDCLGICLYAVSSAVALSPSWFVFCKASSVCLLSAFASLEHQSVLVLVTGFSVAQAAALLSVPVLGCAGCGFWCLQQQKRERIPQGLDVCLEVLWKQVWIARAVSNISVNCCLCVRFCWGSAAKRQTQFCAQSSLPGQLSTSRMNTQGGHISSLTGLLSTTTGTPRGVELLKQEL